MEYDPHDIQVLRLLKSFFEIHQPEIRETVVRMAEALAQAAGLGCFVDNKPSDANLN